MKRETSGAAKFFKIQFADEKNWKTFLDQFVDDNPSAYLEPTGTLGFLVAKSSVGWIKAHIDSTAYRSLTVIKDPNEADDQDAADESTFSHRGTPLDPNFDDPRWLQSETERLETENEQLRRKITP